MQYALIALIVVVAVALVAIPFIRAPRGAGAGDLDAPDRGVTPGVQDPRGPESSDPAPERDTRAGPSLAEPAGRELEAGPQPLPPKPRTTPAPAVTTPAPPAPAPAEAQPPGEAGAEELPQAAPPPPAPSRPLGASAAPVPAQRYGPDQPVARADTRLELEILRYREALRAGTICEHCSSANPPGSRYCKECGEQL